MNREEVLAQLDGVLTEWKTFQSRSVYDDCSDLPETEVIAKVNTLGDTVARFAPSGSHFKKNFDSIMEAKGKYPHRLIVVLPGILLAMKQAYEKEYLGDIEELVHGSMFKDFLEMAAYLLEEEFKDAAAVIAGGTLEQHLRKLSTKNGLPTMDNNNKPLRAEFLNDRLFKATVYDKGKHKNVTAWLNLRNDAAHAHYDRYKTKDVDLMIQGIRNFINQNPA